MQDVCFWSLMTACRVFYGVKLGSLVNGPSVYDVVGTPVA